MTDNEIIKALECCSHRNGDLPCVDCPAYKIAQMCMEDLMSDAIDLINRQKAEIERLQMDNKQLQSDVINANQNWDHIKGLWECEKEKVESAKQKVICACKMLNTVKSEAIKEFAEKLKNRNTTMDKRIISVEIVDNLVKEMTEVETNQRKEDEGKRVKNL